MKIMSNILVFGYVHLILSIYFLPTEAGFGRLFGIGRSRRHTSTPVHEENNASEESEASAEEESPEEQQYERQDGWSQLDYNNVEYGNEEVDRSGPERGYEPVDLDEGIKKIQNILSQIEDYLPTYVDQTTVEQATDIDDLIEKANQSLSKKQDDKLTRISREKRAELLRKLGSFIKDFNEYLKRTGNGDYRSPAPLTYLLTNIRNSLKNHQETEESEEED